MTSQGGAASRGITGRGPCVRVREEGVRLEHFHFIRVIIEHNSGFNEDQPGCVRDGDSQERDMAIQEIPFYTEVDR